MSDSGMMSQLDELLNRAWQVVDLELRYSMRSREYSEEVQYDPQYAAALRYFPVMNILHIQARTKTWGIHKDLSQHFGWTKWIDINPHDVRVVQAPQSAHLILPRTLFGTPYEEVRVTYLAGYEDVPETVILAVEAYADLMSRQEWNPESYRLPDFVLAALEPYRRREA